MHVDVLCPFRIIAERMVELGELIPPDPFVSVFKCGDSRGEEPLLTVAHFPVDVNVFVDDPREFGNGISVCANMTTMSCFSGVMDCSCYAAEVNQVPRLGDVVLDDSANRGIGNRGGIGFCCVMCW